ncbi:unnamed protein product [Prorocentrum cordatum]|uniref:Uncharacterized protein n=1 Tax=Prorocentrum cordatum TaxID=2364126 RepID=A0ABN9Q8N7_9DINO|nr:unnamed protein product [Polarella glacialis]
MISKLTTSKGDVTRELALRADRLQNFIKAVKHRTISGAEPGAILEDRTEQTDWVVSLQAVKSALHDSEQATTVSSSRIQHVIGSEMGCDGGAGSYAVGGGGEDFRGNGLSGEVPPPPPPTPTPTPTPGDDGDRGSGIGGGRAGSDDGASGVGGTSSRKPQRDRALHKMTRACLEISSMTGSLLMNG